jgi:DNA-directed RNA polymerase alpha subunit
MRQIEIVADQLGGVLCPWSQLRSQCTTKCAMYYEERKGAMLNCCCALSRQVIGQRSVADSVRASDIELSSIDAFNPRIRNAMLRYHGVTVLRQLTQLTRKDILYTKNISYGSLDTIIKTLAAYGFQLREI